MNFWKKKVDKSKFLSFFRGGLIFFHQCKTEFKCFKQDGDISLNRKHLKLVDQFIYLGSNISSTENDINISIGKAWAVSYSLSIMWKSDLSAKIKAEFFIAVLALLYGCNVWTNETLKEKR